MWWAKMQEWRRGPEQTWHEESGKRSRMAWQWRGVDTRGEGGCERAAAAGRGPRAIWPQEPLDSGRREEEEWESEPEEEEQESALEEEERAPCKEAGSQRARESPWRLGNRQEAGLWKLLGQGNKEEVQT